MSTSRLLQLILVLCLTVTLVIPARSPLIQTPKGLSMVAGRAVSPKACCCPDTSEIYRRMECCIETVVTPESKNSLEPLRSLRNSSGCACVSSPASPVSALMQDVLRTVYTEASSNALSFQLYVFAGGDYVSHFGITTSCWIFSASSSLPSRAPPFLA